MANTPHSIMLRSGDATSRAAAQLAVELEPGDTLLLQGPVGAGKTHFARAAIQSVLPAPEDVPSPTFTLVQTYDTRAGALWHCDLYRIGSVDEVEELGLLEAFDTAICLVEWPNRLGPLCPQSALTITLEDGADPETRKLTAEWHDEKWHKKLKCWAGL